ncbi:VOC family protein [Winogradskyella immobilis]|uniref:VOC family protein n=1 Tax=Winogradskyella immobilis TaxID=2816852 RepID=A0ABS8EKQ7_9FLAO|nr:VOC family protein [Winogradskyella immobilis]MCC1483602.1 VOC family protein [Winogradskyella immobilis]MCG0015696.1 VOC family protein [Winogradskyella immobilis]
MISWFEVAVSDMDRAKTFYETVFDITINVMDFGGTLMGWFPNIEDTIGATGSLVQNSNYVPSQEGSLVYFMSNDVQIELDRVEAAGGKIFQEKTKISDEYGYMGVFIDSEGNRIALHSNQ